MFCENIESQYIVMQEGTSEGTQIALVAYNTRYVKE